MRSAVLFGLVVSLCLAQIAWWIIFQFRETDRLENAVEMLAVGDVQSAARELGAGDDGELGDHVRRRRIMFASEGAALGLCVLVGVVFFYTALLRERRVRRDHERFLTGATHELKTPLATVRLGLESMLAGRTPPEKQPHYLAAMVQEIDRLEIGIGNLLTAAGLRSATRAINPTPGDLAKDLRKVLDELRGRFETAGIELDSGALPPVEIVRDPSAMHIVLHCLLDNAVKYSPAGSQVRVSLSDLGDQAELRVADSGHGMTREDQQRAFEPFYRGAQREHTGGSGLGLYLVDELVRLHGGEVSASSPGPGQGSEFVIRLPKGRCAS